MFNNATALEKNEDGNRLELRSGIIERAIVTCGQCDIARAGKGMNTSEGRERWPPLYLTELRTPEMEFIENGLYENKQLPFSTKTRL